MRFPVASGRLTGVFPEKFIEINQIVEFHPGSQGGDGNIRIDQQSPGDPDPFQIDDFFGRPSGFLEDQRPQISGGTMQMTGAFRHGHGLAAAALDEQFEFAQDP